MKMFAGLTQASQASIDKPIMRKIEQPIRIMLVEEHRTMRAGMCLLIENQPGFTVVAEVSNSADVLVEAKRAQPDVVILGLNGHEDEELALVPALLECIPDVHILLQTAISDIKVHQQAICLGAKGVVLKEQSAEILFKAIARVHAGEVWLDGRLMARVLSELVAPGKEHDVEKMKIATLTQREHQVILLIGEGLKNKQIADRLFISQTTVRHHLTSIFSKLDVTDRLALVLYAHKHGLIKLPSNASGFNRPKKID